MAIATGYSGIAGAAKETTFRTAVAMTTKLPIIGESFSDQIKQIESEILSGSAGQDTLDKGPISVTGAGDFDVRYTTSNSGRTIFFGSDLLFAIAMGSASWHAGSSTNILKLTDDLDKFLTMAFHKKVRVNELVSLMLGGFKVGAKSGEPWKVSFDGVAYDFVRGDPASGSPPPANRQSQFDALTGFAIAKRALFQDTVIRLGDTTGALGNNNKMGCSEWGLTYSGNLSQPEHTTPDQDSGHSDAYKTIQMVRSDRRKVEIEFTLPRIATYGGSGGALQWGTQLETWRAAETILQCDLVVNPPSDSTRIVKIMLPYGKIVDLQQQMTNAGPIPQKVKLQFIRNASRNTYMTDAAGSAITEEFQMEFKNSNNTAAEYGRNAAIM